MKVGFAKVGNNKEDLLVVDEVIVFSCAKAMIIQPSEIKKVPVGFVIKVESGYVLNISTHSFLAEKASEVFPALITIDSTTIQEPLFIPVRNAGRSQINLHEGDPLAKAYVVRTSEVEGTEFKLQETIPAELPKSRPPKRNADIVFEVK